MEEYSMNRMIVLILCLALISLACLSTASPMVTYPADTPTAGATASADEVFDLPVSQISSATATNKLCAVVIAAEALHLRIDANEHARILTWLKNGEVVQVVSDANIDWWRIDARGVSGYARSIYLQIVEC
jgi:uncharacterized protein YgiM (DUF1202 family)